MPRLIKVVETLGDGVEELNDYDWGRVRVRMRRLPHVVTLQEAVLEVIRSNQAEGYPPTRFIQVTDHGHADNLASICERMILKGETLEAIERALRSHPNMLTLEDFVAQYGRAWGMSEDVIRTAIERVKYFDQLAGDQRFSGTDRGRATNG